MRPFVVAAAALGFSLGAAAHAFDATPQQSLPAYRASVDLVTIDVQVASATGAAVRFVSPTEFDIRIAGRKRAAASGAFLHHDEGTITRTPLSQGRDASDASHCIFGFHRKTDRATDHYLVSVDRDDSDRQQVKDVKVTMTDPALTVQWVSWRTPIRTPK